MNLYQQSGICNLIGWKLEVGVASKFIQHDMVNESAHAVPSSTVICNDVLK